MGKGDGKFNLADWVIIMTGFIFADLIQIVFNLFGIGTFVNRILSPLVGASFIFYGFLRGVNVWTLRKLVNTLLFTALETIGIGADVLPTFTIMGVIAIILEKSENVPIAGEMIKKAESGVNPIKK